MITKTKLSEESASLILKKWAKRISNERVKYELASFKISGSSIRVRLTCQGGLGEHIRQQTITKAQLKIIKNKEEANYPGLNL